MNKNAKCQNSDAAELKQEYKSVVNNFVSVFEDEPLDYRDAQRELGQMVDQKSFKKCVSHEEGMRVSHYVSEDSSVGIKFKYKALD